MLELTISKQRLWIPYYLTFRQSLFVSFSSRRKERLLIPETELSAENRKLTEMLRNKDSVASYSELKMNRLLAEKKALKVRLG